MNILWYSYDNYAISSLLLINTNLCDGHTYYIIWINIKLLSFWKNLIFNSLRNNLILLSKNAIVEYWYNVTSIQLCTDKLKIHDDVLTRAIFRRESVAERETSRINFRESSRFLALSSSWRSFLFVLVDGTGRPYIPDADMRGSTHPRVPVSFCFSEFFTQFPGPRFCELLLSAPPPREICFGLWEVRPRFRISFTEVNVFNFAPRKSGERREKERDRKENDDNATRWERRQDHYDDDDDDLTRLLSGPSHACLVV